MTAAMPVPDIIMTNGIPMAVHQSGTGPAVVLLHGFPELALSWRHQMSPLSQAGWRAIAPDQRGYGGTGCHGEVSDYRMVNLARDIVGLLDVLEIARAVVVGHDFGGMVAWTLARDHSDRVAGVISLNTPYTRQGDRDLLSLVREHRGSSNYMVCFQKPGDGEAALERDVEATFTALFRRPALTLQAFRRAELRLRALPMSLFTGEPPLMGTPIMGPDEVAAYVEAFRRTGFTGALNWYRNMRRNWEDGIGRADRVDVPALMVSAADDYFLPPDTTIGMEAVIPDLERALIADCGHWTQHEQPNIVNRLLLGWLERRMRPLF